MSDPRGIRNHNPGNIRRNADAWRGLADEQTDPSFFQFSEPVWGIRALAKILLNYYRLYDLNTVEGVINRWAPPSENDTEAYIKHVADVLDVERDEPIAVDDLDTLKVLTMAIIRHENGQQPYDHDLIRRGVAYALGKDETEVLK